jgi:pyruvate-formate lyase-activating enzyme
VTRALVADIVDTSCVDGPGNRYVVFLQGCTFNCLACHNPHTIDRRPSAGTKWMDVADLHADIASKASFLSGVTVSGGEPTLQWEAVHELFDRLAADPTTARLTRLVDSNGDADPQVWDVLATSMHGAMIDLKAFDPDVHQLLTGRSNTRALAAIRQLAALDRLTEVRLLIVPGVNDASEQLAATARWLGGLDPTPQTIVQGFRHEGTRSVARRFREATSTDLTNVVVALVGHGLTADHVRRTSPTDVSQVDVLGDVRPLCQPTLRRGTGTRRKKVAHENRRTHAHTGGDVPLIDDSRGSCATDA